MCNDCSCSAFLQHTVFRSARTNTSLNTETRECKGMFCSPETGGNHISQQLSIVWGVSSVPEWPSSLLLPVTHCLTFILPAPTQRFLLNVKWLCCQWRPLGVGGICQASVQYPLDRSLKGWKAWKARGHQSQLSGPTDHRLIVSLKEQT